MSGMLEGMDVVRRWLAPPLVAALCCLALAGCGDDAEPSQPEETAVDDTPSASPPESSPSESPTQSSPAPAASAAEQSVADLAATLGIDETDVEVVAVEQVTWRNGSRGCARPGMAYTQALVEGSRITLRAGGRTYEYHSGGSRPPSRCEKPTE
jgi:hypothetical protein